MSIAIGKRAYEPLNKQVSEEFASAYMYLSMSSVFADMGLNGCAHWMLRQASEERDHAMKIYNHILLRGHKVRLMQIAAPKYDWRTPLHVFEDMQRHEQKVTNMILGIYENAASDKDYQTMNFMQWFIDEQLEEESTASALLDRLRKMHVNDLGVILFDKELAERQ